MDATRTNDNGGEINIKLPEVPLDEWPDLARAMEVAKALFRVSEQHSGIRR